MLVRVLRVLLFHVSQFVTVFTELKDIYPMTHVHLVPRPRQLRVHRAIKVHAYVSRCLVNLQLAGQSAPHVTLMIFQHLSDLSGALGLNILVRDLLGRINDLPA